MPKSIKLILFLLILGAAATFTGWRVWQAYEKKSAVENSKSGGGKSAGRLITVSTSEVRSVPVRENLEITGSLKPKEQVDVTSKITGRVEQLKAQVGDRVRQGQAIAQLEDAELEQQVRRAEAALEVVRATQQQRKAELNNAKAGADRAKQLFEQGLIAKADYEASQTSYHVIQAQMALVGAQAEQAKAELKEFTIQKSQMKIEAPISGYVAQRFVDVGAVISPSTPIIRIVNLSTMVTVANVPEKDLPKLSPGSSAIVTIDAFPDQEFTGKVARIAPVLDAGTRTALVEIEIPNPSGAIKAEMFARVRMDLTRSRKSLVVPRDSLVYRGQQPGVFVVQEKQQPIFRPVETGASFGGDIEVVANLAPGTTVVSRGAAMLKPGDQIRVVGEEDAGLLPGSSQRRTQPPAQVKPAS